MNPYRDEYASLAGRREQISRLRHAILFERNRLGKPPATMRVVDLIALLDEEAADIDRKRAALDEEPKTGNYMTDPAHYPTPEAIRAQKRRRP